MLPGLREPERQPRVGALLVGEEAAGGKGSGRWLSRAGFTVETFSQAQEL